MPSDVQDVIGKFDALYALVPILAINWAADNERTVRVLDELPDKGRADESHWRSSVVETLGILIAAQESQAVPFPVVSGIGGLCFPMDQLGLRPGDLPETGI